ncbi:MAG: LysR family transcriptional regulator [Gammaproteobacteria bacterium]|nr:MAG: LysR family transcriptional regulator [Gammaproteobacteria bacterium]
MPTKQITIKQLRYLVAIAQNRFNISLTAEKLFTSQPGISKQIRLLEEQLGCAVFARSGKTLIGLTETGETILKQAHIVLTEYDNLLRLANHPDTANESFRIATTSTQSNYVLPTILPDFHQRYPDVKLHIQDGNMDQLIDIAKNQEADCLILSGINTRLQRQLFADMLMIPCYEWHQVLVCHQQHPLAKQNSLTLKDIAQYPIITYPSSKYCGSAVQMMLSEKHLQANIFATSNDPHTIKHYAEMQMGIGLIAPMAYHPDKDRQLTAVSLENILPKCTTIIAVARHNMLKPHVYHFIRLFAPHLDHQTIDRAINDSADISPQNIKLPPITAPIA